MTDSERAALAVANYLAKLRPLIEARTPLPWRPDERDPQRVVQAAKAVVGPLREAFQLFEKYRGAARSQLLEARRQQILNHLPPRPSPVTAFGITRMFHLDIACKIIEAAVENVELIAKVADSPESQSHDDLALHLADGLPDISGKKWERFLVHLEVEARDAAGKAQAGNGKTTAGGGKPANARKPKGKADAPKAAANRGGRPREWDKLWAVIQEQDKAKTKPTDKRIASIYNQEQSNPIAAGKLKRATAAIVVSVRYERTHRGRKQNPK
jgi:hypothetical protein